MIDLESLDALASKATPGPWESGDDGSVSASGAMIARVYDADDFPCLGDDDERNDAEFAANLAFIAACSPDVIRALVRRLKAAEAVADSLSLTLRECRAWSRDTNHAHYEGAAGHECRLCWIERAADKAIARWREARAGDGTK